ncbi:MAG: site-2 protease family protein [Deltaproteobacteria bacterium]
MKIFNIPIRVEWSWLLVLTLVVWSLSAVVFPAYCSGHSISEAKYWTMGLVGALGLFASILFHEISHAIVAKRYGVPIKKITLFIFGGVAEIVDEPSNSKAEFRMAVVGPLVSYFLSGVFFLMDYFSLQAQLEIEVRAILNYLAWGNFALASFNLLPAFPLDGGRILRSILWSRKKNLLEATRIAAKMGSGFGAVIMALGVLTFLFRNFVGGMWYFLIGMFLREAAAFSYQQTVLKKSLEGEWVARFMNTNPVTVSPELTLKELMDQYLMKHQFKMFPVVENGKLLGCISVRELKKVGQEKWSQSQVRDHLTTVSSKNTVSPATDAKQAFQIMTTEKESRLMVAENQRLVGVLTLKDMLQYLSLIFEFEDTSQEAA